MAPQRAPKEPQEAPKPLILLRHLKLVIKLEKNTPKRKEIVKECSKREASPKRSFLGGLCGGPGNKQEGPKMPPQHRELRLAESSAKRCFLGSFEKQVAAKRPNM